MSARHRAVTAEPSCWTCKLGHYDPGSSGDRVNPPEPDCMECTLMELKEGFPPEVFDRLEEVEWVEEKCPAICGRFEPVMIEKCGYCGEAMNVPEYSHTHYVSSSYADPIAVHATCQPAAQEQLRYQEALQERREREYEQQLKDEGL